MKKLLTLVLIIFLPVIAYFEYVSWTRFSSSEGYLYEISDKIDPYYYNADLVKEYYENALEIGRFARQKHVNDDIDVLYPDEDDKEAVNASKYYSNLIARTKYLETLLIKSADLKKSGFSNEDITRIEETGKSAEQLKIQKALETHVGLKFGARSKEVWNVQKSLTDKGYEVPIDGLFGPETETQLKEFQASKNLYPSGEVDFESAELLFAK